MKFGYNSDSLIISYDSQFISADNMFSNVPLPSCSEILETDFFDDLDNIIEEIVR